MQHEMRGARKVGEGVGRGGVWLGNSSTEHTDGQDTRRNHTWGDTTVANTDSSRLHVVDSSPLPRARKSHQLHSVDSQ